MNFTDHACDQQCLEESKQVKEGKESKCQKFFNEYAQTLLSHCIAWCMLKM